MIFIYPWVSVASLLPHYMALASGEANGAGSMGIVLTYTHD